MKMTDILDKDKSGLITELTNAQTPEKAVKVLENESDKLLLRHNEQCNSEAVRDAAAYLMQAVRLSLPLIDSDGNAKVWEHEEKDRTAKKGSAITVPAAILIIAGICLCIYGMLPHIMTVMAGTDAVAQKDLLIRVAAVFGGLAAGIFGGVLIHKPKVKKKREQHVEIHVDADKVYRYFRTVILSVDQSLDEIAAKERWEKREQAGSIDGRPATTPEIDLFADLIAASYSRDPEYALEKIDDIKYYLHKQQIEVVDYSDKTKQYFDMMPGASAGTIRPALIADGNLLKKGLASTGK